MTNGGKAIVRLKFPSQKQVSSLFDALTPEANAQVTRRASIRLQIDGLFLELTVDADDIVALRATLNAYLRWINSTINVLDAVEKT